RGTACRRLHHDRGSAVGDEHEPGANIRAGAARAHHPLALDLLPRAAARHAARGGALRPHRRAVSGALRQAASSRRRTLHLSLSFHGACGMTHYDVIIIGTGAGGGTLAYHLAPSGKKILLIERGDYVRREKDNWSSRAVNVDAKYHTREAWRDRDGKPLHPHTNYYVGGHTKFTR